MVFRDVILGDRVLLWHLKDRLPEWQTIDDLKRFTFCGHAAGDQPGSPRNEKGWNH